MKFNRFNIKSLLPVALSAMLFTTTGCIGDLDVDPTIDKSVDMTFDKDGNFRKIYANMALTGQQGPAGKADINGIDEGQSAFVRQIWNMNELPTDEAICCWSDPGTPEYNFATWDGSHGMIKCGYYRLIFGVTLANYFLEKTEGTQDAETLVQRAETRFLRALYYFYEMDLFGRVTFTTKVSAKDTPEEYSREQIFAYIENELKECVEDMKDPLTNTYGRVDKAAAWLLLSRLYLNAEVYTGKAMWKEAAEYADKVMKSGYGLCSDYRLLFMGDNNANGAQKEVILPILQDGVDTQSYGGSLFLIASTSKDDMPAKGTSEVWAGNRARKELVKKFFPSSDIPSGDAEDMIKAARDQRAMFYGKDRNPVIEEVSVFTDGYSCDKFTNVHSNGNTPNDVKFSDMDVPFMRAAEAYLTYAEAKLRLGDKQEAKRAIDMLKDRAHANKQPEYTLDDVCDEWAREFFFEGRRRMDLVRFGKFGGNTDYNWEWKGGVKQGTLIPAYRNVFPVPTDFIVANPNLHQNDGYGKSN